jgi:hypothetical protein
MRLLYSTEVPIRLTDCHVPDYVFILATQFKTTFQDPAQKNCPACTPKIWEDLQQEVSKPDSDAVSADSSSVVQPK